MSNSSSIGILGTGSYVPESVLGNRELADTLGIDPDWIEVKTGFRERRVAAPHEATSDLATTASERALMASGLTPSDLDLIVVATSSPDRPLPATACTVQANIGAKCAVAFDLQAVCTGFVYALGFVWSAMRGDSGISNALIIGADTYSRILDYEDPKTSVLFGDGAGAVVVGETTCPGLLVSELGADGTKDRMVEVPSGGSRSPASEKTVSAREHFFRMDGRAVRHFVHEIFPTVVRDTLRPTDLTLENVDLIVPHQANVRLLEDCIDELGIPPDKVHFTAQFYGNTGAASVPITLDDAVQSGRVQPDHTVMLVSFGGGMTWGGILMRWPGPHRGRHISAAVPNDKAEGGTGR